MGLIRLFFWGLLLYIGYRVLKALVTTGSSGAQDDRERRDAGEETVQDPVCGIYLSRDNAIVGTLEGRRYYFCSMGCLEKFREQLEHTNQS